MGIKKYIVDILRNVSKECEKMEKSKLPLWICRCWYWVMIFVGRKEFKKLSNKYPDCTFLYTPTASIGDLCYIRRNLSDIIKKNEIENEVIFLVEESVSDAAKLLNFEKIYVLSKMQLFPIVLMHTLYGDKIKGLFNCYPWEMLYQSHIKNPLQTEDFIYKNAKNNVLSRYKISGGRNIILAPHEKTISLIEEQKLPDIFWEKVTDNLKRKGYRVYTNCNVSKGEKEIKGSEVIDIPLKHIWDIMQNVEGMIAIRSGLVDLLCTIPVKQIVLYPDAEWLDKFSLKNVANNELLEEMVYKNDLSELSRLAMQVADRF